ncbi:MAG: hypothetical protein DMD41_15515 [Gemmatimonadetes bacterium]|nr:MAG: hypothetical protein DMD41_15515 [Gemmatimonadota bacterium]
MRRLLMTGCLFVAAMGGGAGCFVGPSTKNFQRMAQRPEGAAVEVDVGKGRPLVSGELLEVRDTALLVRDTTGEGGGGGGEITLVPFRLVRGGRVPARGGSWEGGPRGRTWDRLRLLSRFPYGLAAPQLQALLAAYGRDSLTVVR